MRSLCFLVLLCGCAAAKDAMPPHLVSGFVAPRIIPGKATIEFLRPGMALAKMLTVVTETDGKFVANIPSEGRTRAFVEPGRRLLFLAAMNGNAFGAAQPLWIDVRAGRTYLVHVEVEDGEMVPTPVRPDQPRQWSAFRRWREESRLYAVGDVPSAPVAPEAVCKRWYSDYSVRWEQGMDDSERLAHTLFPTDGR